MACGALSLPPCTGVSHSKEYIQTGPRFNAARRCANTSDRIRKLLALLTDKDCELPISELGGSLPTTTDAPVSYLEAREKDRRALTPYLIEARRRADKGDVAGLKLTPAAYATQAWYGSNSFEKGFENAWAGK